MTSRTTKDIITSSKGGDIMINAIKKAIKKVLANRQVKQAQIRNRQQFKSAYEGLEERGY